MCFGDRVIVTMLLHVVDVGLPSCYLSNAISLRDGWANFVVRIYVHLYCCFVYVFFACFALFVFLKLRRVDYVVSYYTFFDKLYLHFLARSRRSMCSSSDVFGLVRHVVFLWGKSWCDDLRWSGSGGNKQAV